MTYPPTGFGLRGTRGGSLMMIHRLVLGSGKDCLSAGSLIHRAVGDKQEFVSLERSLISIYAVFWDSQAKQPGAERAQSSHYHRPF